MNFFYSLIRTPLALLIGEKCTVTLLDNFNIFDKDCLKHAVIKGLGFGLVLGGSIVKVPQIQKVVSQKSIYGLSQTSLILECLSNIVATSYNFRSSNPFSSYGEALFIGFQNLILIALCKHYSKKSYFAVIFALLALWFMLISNYFTSIMFLQACQLFSVPLMVFGRISQIVTNNSNKSTGQLAAFTIFANFIGTFARVITTLAEIKDLQLILTSIINATVNGILAYQMIIYWKKSGYKSNKNHYEFGSKTSFFSK
ncbi:Mannose-P-dolichol utilization defect 1 protein [Smittium culicis]|uniref:Mannose-P-dolichol utilization defect 1 protein homolog n=1 Tax=Smittium culicis TaxID=133412 RepID=A0A1R1YCZ3_9FUNG|nr:Mannose-P-dolichol utilization defect 1 protein [Smittium culicis]OMJ24794.1 Mannose-P-dolichol utilization defect 1 protein [Smittium culicis]